jgi:large subunit ribosomal protein L23
MELMNVIIRPLVTEKTNHQQGVQNAYTFQVHQDANKHDVKRAIERIYSVKVVDVRTMTRKGKPRRSRYRMSHSSDWKRAVVVLDENSRIETY